MPISVENVRASVTIEGPVEEVRFASTDEKGPRLRFAMYFEGDERGKILHGDVFRLDLVKTLGGDEAANALAEAEIKSITETAKAAVESRRAKGRAARK